jgi:hypothetical protein
MAEQGETTGSGSGSIDERRRAILGKLRFNETEFLKGLEETVERARKYLGIEPHTGRVVLTDASKALPVPMQVRLLLVGRYFSRDLGDVSTDKLGYKEIAAELNRPPSGISTELTEMVRDGDVARDQDGLVSVPFHRIESTLLEAERHRQNEEPAAGENSGPAPFNGAKAGSRRRVSSRKLDPEIASMLSSGKDTSSFAWLKELKTAQDKGLAALIVAEELYGKKDLTCTQLESILNRVFGVPATRASINMAFLRIKGELIYATQDGKDIRYSLLEPGKRHLDSLKSAPKRGTLDAIELPPVSAAPP